MEYRQLLAILLYFSLSSSDNVPIKPLIIPLNGDSWIVKAIKNSTTTRGTVPGGIYTDLRNAGVLKDDIFFEDNDIKYRWVAKEDWIYSTTFQVGQEILSRENVCLVFHGVDTIAKIVLNDKTVGEVNNMFLRYKFDVKSLLKEGQNDLEVRFQSPITAADKLSASSKYRIPPNCTPSEYNGECHVNFLRKMQASFAWDWGPAFPSVGIWKPVDIEAYDGVVIRSVSVTTDKLMDTWEVTTKIYLDTAPNKTLKLHADIKIFSTLPSGKISQLKLNLDPIDVEIKSNEEGEADLSIGEIFVNENYVSRWWPNGYGSQKLYSLQIDLKTEDKETTNKTVQFGFRTVQLVQDDIDCHKDTKGKSFYFKVNDVKIFAKGSNYVPSHILPEIGTNSERVRMTLYSAKEAHMNMIRVWGGGVYESDDFYKLCDEMGIMVWQDMMFACNMYPADDDFLKSVSKEIVQNVRRLQRHPSIILWAGNNENEAALAQSWYGTSGNFEQYKGDYQKLYVDTIKKLVIENDKSRSYITSSPTSGIESDNKGSQTPAGTPVRTPVSPYDRLYGDVHEFTYYDNNWLPSSVTPARFISEFGIQSLPSFSTLSSATKPENVTSISSSFFQTRQHHPSGYQQMASEIGMNMKNPETGDIKTLIYYSQINQAMSIKTKAEAFRRFRDVITEGGEGMTMGAMYWQLNDVWQAPTWSSIEYGGKWKMLHNFAKEFFAQILVSPWLTEKGNVAVTIVSDKRSGPPLFVYLKTYVYNWNSTSPVATIKSERIRLNPLSSVIQPEVPLTKILDIAECSPKDEASRDCFLVFDLQNKDNGNEAPQAFLLPEYLNRINGPKKSTIQVVKISKVESPYKSSLLPKEVERYDITLQTDAIALFVWIDVGNMEGHFYENGFLFLPKEKTISFMSYKSINECLLSEAITIQTINGSFSIDENVKKSCMINDKKKESTPEEKKEKEEKKEEATVPKEEEKESKKEEEKTPPKEAEKVPPTPATPVVPSHPADVTPTPESKTAEQPTAGSVPYFDSVEVLFVTFISSLFIILMA